jgi:hypothetical protein
MAVDWTLIKKHENRGGPATIAYVPMKRGRPIGGSGPTVCTAFDIPQHNQNEIKDLDLSNSLTNKLLPFAQPNSNNPAVIAFKKEGKKPREISILLKKQITNSAIAMAPPVKQNLMIPSQSINLGYPGGSGWGKSVEITKPMPLLELSVPECEELDAAVRQNMLETISKVWNSLALQNGGQMFDLQPSDIQTAVVDFLYQRGPNAFKSKTVSAYKEDVEYGRLITSGKLQEAIDYFTQNIYGVAHTPQKYLPRDRRADELNLMKRSLPKGR